jgi:hypothetical protein
MAFGLFWKSVCASKERQSYKVWQDGYHAEIIETNWFIKQKVDYTQQSCTRESSCSPEVIILVLQKLCGLRQWFRCCNVGLIFWVLMHCVGTVANPRYRACGHGMQFRAINIENARVSEPSGLLLLMCGFTKSISCVGTRCKRAPVGLSNFFMRILIK